MNAELQNPTDQLVKEFVALVIKSPVAVVTIALSTLFGYGISFILFDYRRSPATKAHTMFHVAIGLGYAALIFCVVNFDLMSRTMTIAQMTDRMPLTLLVGFLFAFFVMIVGGIWREFYKPYATGVDNG
ncbi:MAG: hypothetical protein MN733_42135 [Nitrososphaera sp.]|nr:hypothetical protein [Nitrososphaera sp.]